MIEATHLLSYLTVSETGYKLGFTNLSHFGRVFEKHFLMKPKPNKGSLN
jgi:AraC-like DNA-binding protein